MSTPRLLLLCSLLAGVFGTPAVAHAADAVTIDTAHWIPDTTTGVTQCIQAPGPIAVVSDGMEGPGVNNLRILFNTDQALWGAPKVTSLVIHDVAGFVPDVTFSNPLGVAYPSSRRDACEPIVDAYFDFLWWTDPSPNNDGYTQFPNGSFQFTATVTYQTFSIFGPQTHTVTMEQPTTWTVNNVWVEDRTTYPGGRR